MVIGSNVSNTRVAVSRDVFVSSILLRVGISGAALAVWAAVSAVSGETSMPPALAALVAGVAIAALSLRKAWSLLEQDGDPDARSPSEGLRNRRRVPSVVAGAARERTSAQAI